MQSKKKNIHINCKEKDQQTFDAKQKKRVFFKKNIKTQQFSTKNYRKLYTKYSICPQGFYAKQEF